MPMQVFDMVEGAEPTLGTDIFVGFLTFLLLLPSIYRLFLYVMRALGLYRIAKRRGIHHPWLAWVPCGRDWLLGSISDQYQYVTLQKKRYARVFLPLVAFPSEILSWFSRSYTAIFPFLFMSLESMEPLSDFLLESDFNFAAVGLIRAAPYLLAALFVIRLFSLYRLYQSSLPRRKLPLLILNILVPFSPSVTIFAVRDYDNGMPPRRSEPEVPIP